MGEAALRMDPASTVDAQDWAFRLAQQAFAALLEDDQRTASFRIAAVRAAARSRLTALSVDDRGRLQRWLALQLATLTASAASKILGTLTALDPLMATSVRGELPVALISCGRGLPAYRGSGRARAGAIRPAVHVDPAGLPPASRPSMLPTLFR